MVRGTANTYKARFQYIRRSLFTFLEPQKKKKKTFSKLKYDRSVLIPRLIRRQYKKFCGAVEQRPTTIQWRTILEWKKDTFFAHRTIFCVEKSFQNDVTPKAALQLFACTHIYLSVRYQHAQHPIYSTLVFHLKKIQFLFEFFFVVWASSNGKVSNPNEFYS